MFLTITEIAFYTFFSIMFFFSCCVVFFIMRDWWINRKNKATGINKEFAELYDSIKHASHPVEISFITERVFDFEQKHRGEKTCKELYIELMQFAQGREIELKKYLGRPLSKLKV